ncbi:sensor domain-containing diguanylate cyclase [Aphanothece hegewaldii CCALA 016]|uniref:Sensor domain-containing diguanylate cyclase n=1 Tax=Aphanothece hegewaldii CCALA 016 TaxID=2107694 RepID=A0A2T1M0J1_9CHRO|nr:GGDEF domain-containing protein [Aphanothece hegewaldii]PSF38188.1 sensor domain-containing diguanylate cyclase [Aphanothece hegewaldii CCALA 016]
MMDIYPYPDFSTASVEVLKYLSQRLNFNLWMVTRTEGSDWIVLKAEDHGYGVKEGTVFRWADSFCSQMVAGRGPRIAPCASAVPAYAATPIAQQVTIGAYVGIPLLLESGALFGTLCAIDPSPQSQAIAAELPLIELLARLLCSLLDNDLKLTEQIRRTERAKVEAMTDVLTGIYNRRGWEQLLTAEENRCRSYGNSACVVSIDLDDLKKVNDTYGHASGDILIRNAAQIIKSTIRKQDIVARIGGDEFVILLVDAGCEDGSIIVERLHTQLFTQGVRASIGLAFRNPSLGLGNAWQEADQAMYICKRSHKGMLRG